MLKEAYEAGRRNALIKLAVPSMVDNSAIPYEQRKKRYLEHLEDQAQAGPADYGSHIGTGALIGGGVGGTLGLLGQGFRPGALIPAGIGAALGGIGGGLAV